MSATSRFVEDGLESCVNTCLQKIGNPSGSLDECLESVSRLIKVLGEDKVRERVQESFNKGWQGEQGKGYRVLARIINARS